MKQISLLAFTLFTINAAASVNLALSLPGGDIVVMSFPDGTIISVQTMTNMVSTNVVPPPAATLMVSTNVLPPAVTLPEWTLKARMAANVVSVIVTNMAANGPDTLRKIGTACYLLWLNHTVDSASFKLAFEQIGTSIPAQFLITFNEMPAESRPDVLLGFWLGIHEALEAKGLKGVVP